MYSTNQFSVMRTCYDLCRNIFTSTNSSSHSSVNKYNGHGFKYNRAVEQVILLYNIITYRLNCLMPAYSYGCQNCLFLPWLTLAMLTIYYMNLNSRPSRAMSLLREHILQGVSHSSQQVSRAQWCQTGNHNIKNNTLWDTTPQHPLPLTLSTRPTLMFAVTR